MSVEDQTQLDRILPTIPPFLIQWAIQPAFNSLRNMMPNVVSQRPPLSIPAQRPVPANVLLGTLPAPSRRPPKRREFVKRPIYFPVGSINQLQDNFNQIGIV
ncbi:MAG: hypothetical protein Sylvanvirus1_15 [Sylvanvirus sp.]|uniref:Uncharacterized protein n=1 Tax=Sylvanvirus sp. TaxID=2487774 RepID=A0A3G5AKJ4_9VIRU|nr:MAG: hypothetical protein Sylvanvirus1_15 [Sylvanvirus sp.]